MKRKILEMTIDAYGGVEQLIEELCVIEEGYWDDMTNALTTSYGREGGLNTKMVDRDRSRAWGKANASQQNKLKDKWAKQDARAEKSSPQTSNPFQPSQGTLRALHKNGVTVHNNYANYMGWRSNTHFGKNGKLTNNSPAVKNAKQSTVTKSQTNSQTQNTAKPNTKPAQSNSQSQSQSQPQTSQEKKPFGWNRPSNVFLAPDEIEGTDSSHLYSTPANKPQTSETESERLNRIHGGSSSSQIAQKTADTMTQQAKDSGKTTKVTPEPTEVKKSKEQAQTATSK